MGNLPPPEFAHVNWTLLEKQYKETIEDLKTQNKFAKYAIEHLEEKLEKKGGNIQNAVDIFTEYETQKKEEVEKAGLEKERNEWKKMAEEVAREMDNLLKEKTEWTKKEADLTSHRGNLKSLVTQMERQHNSLEEENKSLRRQTIHLQQKLAASDRINGYHGMMEANLKEELAELQREEALVDCKICFNCPVERVFGCGHAACLECSNQLDDLCHICRKRTGKKVQRIYFT